MIVSPSTAPEMVIFRTVTITALLSTVPDTLMYCRFVGYGFESVMAGLLMVTAGAVASLAETNTV